MSMLKKGVSGEPVKRLQAKLGVAADGSFGPATDAALREYQKKNGLAVDGVAGPDTFAKMGLPELILLKQGTHGDTVKKLQTALGITADGKFGPGTEKAVRDFQQKNGLKADGMAGPLTLAKIDAFKADFTAAVAEKSQMSASEAAAAGAEPSADGAPKRSIWDTIKGWFN